LDKNDQDTALATRRVDGLSEIINARRDIMEIPIPN